MKINCSQCGVKLSFIVIYTEEHKKGLCMNCHEEMVCLRNELIKMLPDVEDKPAPKGYMFINNRCFLNEEHGRQYIEDVYERLGRQ